MKSKKIKAMVVLGTRPEAIKLATLAQTLRAHDDFEVVVVNTGQHLELVEQMLQVFGVKADHNLALMTAGQTPASLYARVLEGMSAVIAAEKPDWVLVQGDTGTAAAAAMAAFFARVPVAHVEAGLRTYDVQSPWPEEYNRRTIALAASLHFAPTLETAQNLLRENIPASSVVMTGNTGIDSLLWMVNRLRAGAGEEFARKWAQLDAAVPFVLCTFHRREAFDSLEEIFEAVAEMAANGEAQFVLPLHPNPRVQAAARKVFGENPRGISLVAPLDYREFVWLMDRATLLLTDSGGVQEEAPTLGRPVIVTREKTERPEAVAAGAAVLAGIHKAGVLRQVRDILGNPARLAEMSVPRPVYGDGRASEIIATALREFREGKVRASFGGQLRLAVAKDGRGELRDGGVAAGGFPSAAVAGEMRADEPRAFPRH